MHGNPLKVTCLIISRVLGSSPMTSYLSLTSHESHDHSFESFLVNIANFSGLIYLNVKCSSLLGVRGTSLALECLLVLIGLYEECRFLKIHRMGTPLSLVAPFLIKITRFGIVHVQYMTQSICSSQLRVCRIYSKTQTLRFDAHVRFLFEAAANGLEYNKSRPWALFEA